MELPISILRQLLLYLLLFLVFLPLEKVKGQDLNLTGSNLPIGIIDTYGQTIVQTNKIQAGLKLVYRGPGQRTYPNDVSNPSYLDYDGQIGIEIRGSSSSNFPKKQYSVETRLSNGENNSTVLLGLPKEKDWIFSAPYSDKSLMRNVLAYELSRRMGKYASRTVYFEMIIDGDYKGVYHLTEKIKQDDNRVDISKLDGDDVAGDSLTGGYIFATDRFASGDVLDVDYFRTPYGNTSRNYVYKDPKGSGLEVAQRAYLKNWWLNFENQMVNVSVSDPVDGMAHYVDVESLVDQIILRELGKDVDAYILSWFMHKNRNDKNRHLIGGPLWDMNLAFDNANYRSGFVTTGWQMDINGSPWWIEALFEDPEFRRVLANRWVELRQSTLSNSEILSFIDSTRNYLNESSGRNFQRWPILGIYVWPNPNGYQNRTSYQLEVNHLKDWISNRSSWMDSQLSFSSCGENLLISEIHYNSVPGFVTEDWIEIYNPSSSAINTSGWVLHDEDGSTGFSLPNVTIQPDGFHVFAQDQNVFSTRFPDITNVSGSFGGSANISLRNSGEKIILVNDAGCFTDKVEYGDEGEWPQGADGSGRTIELKQLSLDNRIGSNWQVSDPFGGTPGMINSNGFPANACSVTPPEIQINEIMYAPPTGEGDDWVELINKSDQTVDLTGWSIEDIDANNFYFLPYGTSLAPGELIVLAEELGEFSAYYPNVSNVVGSFGFGLSGAGETLRLKSEYNCLADELSFSNQNPWPSDAQDSGRSIEWIGSSDNASPEEWLASPDLGGSPGQINTSSVFEASWISPKTDALVPSGQELIVDISAVSGQGINTVEVFLNDISQGTASYLGGRDYEMNLGILADGIYELRAKISDGSGEVINTSVQTICIGNLSPGPFMEASGKVVLEAEHFTSNISRGTDNWEEKTVLSGYSKGGYMVTLPDDGTKVTTGYSGAVSELQYEIEFERAGVYFLSYRGWADAGGNNSVHFGLDGNELASLQDLGLGNANYGEWHWGSTIEDGTRGRFTIPSPGVHTLNLWLREDGTNVDRIYLSSDPNDIPQGLGPRESFRKIGPNAAPILTDPGDQIGFSGDVVSLQLQASDPEGGDLEWVVENLPTGLSFDESSAQITGQLSTSGQWTISASVKDPKLAETSVSFNWLVNDQQVALDLKIILAGAWNGNSMRTELNLASYLPLNNPYPAAGTLSVDASYFQANPDIVDWVWIELRSETSASSSVTRIPAFLRSDGSVHTKNGIDKVVFEGVEDGDYYVVVGHRNHLPVMSASKSSLSFSSVAALDLTNTLDATFGQEALSSLGNSRFGLWQGDVSTDRSVVYSGASNDRVEVLNRSGGPSPFDMVLGYFNEDTNLDGKVVYSGANNDRVEILSSSGGPTSFDRRMTQVPN